MGLVNEGEDRFQTAVDKFIRYLVSFASRTGATTVFYLTWG